MLEDELLVRNHNECSNLGIHCFVCEFLVIIITLSTNKKNQPGEKDGSTDLNQLSCGLKRVGGPEFKHDKCINIRLPTNNLTFKTKKNNQNQPIITASKSLKKTLFREEKLISYNVKK